ncbi:MAG: hypothetical protein AAF449_19285, partial [Myxococcota bacterium]
AIRPSTAVTFERAASVMSSRAIILSYPNSSLFDPVLSFDPLHTRGAVLHKPPSYIQSIFEMLSEIEWSADREVSCGFALRALFYGLMGDHEIRSLLI